MDGLRVGIVGCGLIGRKRAEALGAQDVLVACFDVTDGAARALAADHGGHVATSLADLLGEELDVVVVAVTHDQLAGIATAAVQAGADVLVEKPAGVSVREIEALDAAARMAGRRVKVGFNHRFHPGINRAITEALSGAHGPVLNARARYGHGGRIGYDREWRADARRSGGGEIIDQGMHLLDLFHWLLGPLPLHSALLRTQFWDTQVDDNAAIVLGAASSRDAPWGMFHVTWTEWKNLFSLEITCRTAKFEVDGLVRSYGPQTLRIHRMKPELGPPDTEVAQYPDEDGSWAAEWEHLRDRLADDGALLGDLQDARYAWSIVQEAYQQAGYAAVREGVG